MGSLSKRLELVRVYPSPIFLSSWRIYKISENCVDLQLHKKVIFKLNKKLLLSTFRQKVQAEKEQNVLNGVLNIHAANYSLVKSLLYKI